MGQHFWAFSGRMMMTHMSCCLTVPFYTFSFSFIKQHAVSDELKNSPKLRNIAICGYMWSLDLVKYHL